MVLLLGCVPQEAGSEMEAKMVSRKTLRNNIYEQIWAEGELEL